MNTNDCLLQAQIILTMNDQKDVFHDGLIWVRNGRIEFVGNPEAAPAIPANVPRINMSQHLLLPGLINTHVHLPMSLLRGLADDLQLHDWLEKHIFPAENAIMSPANVAIGTRLGVAEMLLSGTTTCADGYFHEATVIITAREMGIRGCFAQGIIDFPAPGIPDAGARFNICQHYLNTFAGGENSKQHPGIFAHSPYTCSAETLKRAKALARQSHVLFFMHVAETAEEVRWCRDNCDGLSPVQYLHQLGILDSNTVLVHATHVSERDQDLIAAADAAVSINTESGMKLGSGIAPLHGYRQRGVRVALGTDSCASNNDLDLLLELAATVRLHKYVNNDPTFLPAAEALELITSGAAEVLRLSDQVGSLQPGRQADIIALDLHKPHANPLYEPHAHLVHAASGADVDFVMIEGKIIVRDGCLQGADVNEIMAAANGIRPQLLPFAPKLAESKSTPNPQLAN